MQSVAMIPLVGLLLVFPAISAAPGGLLASNDAFSEDSALRKISHPFEDLSEAGTVHHEGLSGSDAGADDDEEGYLKTRSSHGNNGYNHFDSYHKKGGDKYGFEKHMAHGMKKGGKDDNGKGSYYHTAGLVRHYVPLKKTKDHKPAGTDFMYSHYESDGDDSGHYTEGDDGGHFSEGGDEEHYSEGGDEGHYSEGDEGHYSEGEGEGEHLSEGDHGDVSSHEGSSFDGESESGAYHAPGRATSYYIRHY